MRIDIETRYFTTRECWSSLWGLRASVTRYTCGSC